MAIAAVSDSLVLVVSLFALLSIGAYMSENSRKFRAAIWVFLALMSLLTAYFTDYQWLSFDPSRYFSNLNTASYQGFSRSITLTALLALSFIGTVYFRVLVILPCACIVFLAAARAELFGFIFCVVVLEALLSLRRSTNLLFLVLLGGCASAILFLSFDMLLASRQLEIFDLGNSTSWNARQELSGIAWEQIVQNPLSGLFGGDRLTGAGEYAHNALSAWVTYGYFGFVLYYGLALVAFGKSIIRLFNHDVPMARFALYLNTFSLLLITFSAPVFWSVIGLGWGVLLNRRVQSVDSIDHRQTGNDGSPKNLTSRDRIRSPPDGAYVRIEG
ncbi:MAG: O-antigen ligase family protein [Xanthobacteraceae bacterium]